MSRLVSYRIVPSLVCSLLTLGLALSEKLAAAGLPYHSRHIETPGFHVGSASFINNSGQIVGSKLLPLPDGGPAESFLWDPVQGLVVPGGVNSFALALNNAGQVLGGDEAGSYIWDRATGVTRIGGFTEGSGSSVAAFNDSGLVTGYASDVEHENQFAAFVWDRVHGIRLISPAEPNAQGHRRRAFGVAINNAGMVAGSWDFNFSSGELQGERLFVWTEAGGFIDLGTFGNFYARPIAINNHGQVIGLINRPGGVSSFAWDADHGVTDLGTIAHTQFGAIETVVTANNDAGQAVGWFSTTAGFRGFRWDRVQGMIQLPLPISFPQDINESGQICGITIGPRPFVWDPVHGLSLLASLGGSDAFASVYRINDLGQTVGSSDLCGDFAGFSQPPMGVLLAEISPNMPPVARSRDVVVVASAAGTAAASIDDCSHDRDSDDSITLSQSPAGPYAIGETTVTLTATDSHGLTATSTSRVTVLPNVSLTWLSPLSPAPVANKIKVGQVVPHKVSLASSPAINPASITVTLRVCGVVQSGVEQTIFQEVVEDARGSGIDGNGAVDGLMQSQGDHYQFNLNTGNFTDRNTLAEPERSYRSTVIVRDNATGLVLASSEVTLETASK